MPRIAYAEPGQEARDATAVYDQLKEDMGIVPNLAKLLGHSGPATRGMGALLETYFKQLSLEPKIREIAYLTAARFNECGYCQGHHEPLAKKTGLTEGQINQLDESGFDSPDFNDAEKAVIRFAFETSRDVKASEPAVEDLKRHYSLTQIAEIAFVVAMANFVQRIGKNFGAELEQ